MLTPKPFTDAELDKAYVGEPDYMDLGPAYVDAVAYAYETFAGYVRQRAGRDYVMILIGDHQPPALVSGEGAPWDVPDARHHEPPRHPRQPGRPWLRARADAVTAAACTDARDRSADPGRFQRSDSLGQSDLVRGVGSLDPTRQYAAENPPHGVALGTYACA